MRFGRQIGWVLAGLVACGSVLGARAQDGDAEFLKWAREGRKLRALRRGGAPAHGLGMRPADDGAFQRSWRLRVAPAKRGERPGQLLLTDYLPPVADQGEQASCVAWTTGYYAYSYLVSRQQRLRRPRIEDPKYQFSPAFIYNLGNGGRDEGMSLDRGIALLLEKGCATLAEMPYNEKDFTTQPPQPVLSTAERYKARAIGYLFEGKSRRESAAADPEALKTFLAETKQPFVMGIPLFTDFPVEGVEPGYVYDLAVKPTEESFMGLHAVTVLGYDDGKKAFRIVNSWGPKWGEGGFLWLSESFVQNMAVDGFAIVPGGAVARDARGDVEWTSRVLLVRPAEMPDGPSLR